MYMQYIEHFRDMTFAEGRLELLQEPSDALRPSHLSPPPPLNLVLTPISYSFLPRLLARSSPLARARSVSRLEIGAFATCPLPSWG